MKTLRKILIILALIIVIIGIAGYALIYHIGHRGITPYSGDVAISCVTDSMVVYRDSLGIPHVIARNANDLYAATGYLTAQDRLWQMDLFRRVTQGRLSEIFGDDMVNADLMMRALRIEEKSLKVLDSTDKEIIDALEAFSCGVNQFIKEHEKKLPPEFAILGYKPEPWEPKHSVNLIGYMAFDLSCGLNEELVLYKVKNKVDSAMFRLLNSKIKADTVFTFPDFEITDKTIDACLYALDLFKKPEEMGIKIFSGSNNWAVSGKKSATGKPLLANDMHLGIFAPGIWYQIHEVIEGELDVTGVMLPGAPFIISGHNTNIAWGLTNVMLDDVDLYLETVNEDTTKYLLDGQWKDIRKDTVYIKSSSGKTHEKYLYFTHRGPNICGIRKIDSTFISMRWVGNDYSNELRSVYQVNRAKNWDEFRCAMKTFSSTSQNIAYADVNGNIGLYCCAGVPIRKGCGVAILPGNTSEFDWQGYVPFEKLPHTYNPECGYVVSANSRTASPDYSYYISNWFYPPLRHNRIKQLIEATEKHSVESFKKIQTDFKSLQPGQFLPDILTILNQTNTFSEIEQKGLEILNNWDAVYTTESQAPLIFDHYFITFFKNTVNDELGEEITASILDQRPFTLNIMTNLFTEKTSAWFDDANTPDIHETFNDQVVKTFKQVVGDLAALAGNNPEKWQWGKYHQMHLKHFLGKVKLLDMLFNLNRGPFSLPGNHTTVCPYSYPFNNPFHVNNGASERHIYNLANWDESLTVIPTGASGIPGSKFYCNQTKLYMNQQYHADIISLDKIKGQAKFVMKIYSKNK